MFCESTGLALDEVVETDVGGTTNPLVYKVKLRWKRAISHTAAMLVWNLFQKWAAKNDSTPSGRIEFDETESPVVRHKMVRGFTVEIHIKERLGHPKARHPAE